jgi:hypothetical protein
MQQVSALSDGFHVRFTRAFDPAGADDTESWTIDSYTYMLHSDYGSPEVDLAKCEVLGVTLDADHMGLRLQVDGLREGYVHEIRPSRMRSSEGVALQHPRAYYTLVRIPR